MFESEKASKNIITIGHNSSLSGGEAEIRSSVGCGITYKENKWLLLVISARLVNFGIKERHYISMDFSLMGSVVVELCQ